MQLSILDSSCICIVASQRSGVSMFWLRPQMYSSNSNYARVSLEESFLVICPNLREVRARTDPDYKRMKQIGDGACTATRMLDTE